MESLPQPVVLGLAAIGAAWTAVKVANYVRVLLSLFVLPGTSVRTSPQHLRPRKSPSH